MSYCSGCGTRLAEEAAFCHGCGVPVAEPPSATSQPADSGPTIGDAAERIAALEEELAEATDLIDQHADIINGHNTDIAALERLVASSNVYHERFWSRAWAILGHNLAVGAIIYGVIFLIAFLASGVGR